MAKKTGDPTKAELAAAKRRAKKVKAGVKLEAKAKKVGVKGDANRLSPKRLTQVKGMIQQGTAANMAKAGKDIQESKGQGELKKKKDLRVSKKSMHKSTTGGDKTYTGKKKDYKGRK